MAILSCMQFALHADLILFAVFCRFVSSRTFSSMNGRIFTHAISSVWDKLIHKAYFLMLSTCIAN